MLLSSHLPRPGARPLHGPPRVPAAPQPPAPLKGSTRLRPRVLHSRVAKSNALGFFILSLVAGDGAGLEQGVYAWAKGRARGCWHQTGSWPWPWWGLVCRLEEAAGPGSMSSPAPHTEQFIHEPPRPALEGAVGRRFRRESGVGKGPVEGEGARFVPPGCLDRLVRAVPKLVVVLPRKKKGAWEVGKRGQRGWLPLGLCAATSLGPMIRGLAAHCPRGLGAPLPT